MNSRGVHGRSWSEKGRGRNGVKRSYSCPCLWYQILFNVPTSESTMYVGNFNQQRIQLMVGKGKLIVSRVVQQQGSHYICDQHSALRCFIENKSYGGM